MQRASPAKLHAGPLVGLEAEHRQNLRHRHQLAKLSKVYPRHRPAPPNREEEPVPVSQADFTVSWIKTRDAAIPAIAGFGEDDKSQNEELRMSPCSLEDFDPSCQFFWVAEEGAKRKKY